MLRLHPLPVESCQDARLELVEESIDFARITGWVFGPCFGCSQDSALIG